MYTGTLMSVVNATSVQGESNRRHRWISVAAQGKITFILVTTWFALCLIASADCVARPDLQAKLRSTHSVDIYVELGKWFENNRQFACASDAFRQAVKLQPDSAHLAYMLGESLYNAGEVDEAIPPLQESVRLDPTIIQAHLTLGGSLDRIQRIPEAEAQWRAALALDSRSDPALDGLAKDLIEGKDFTAVIALLGAAPLSPERSVNLAMAYTRTGRLDDASRVLLAAHDADPTSLIVSSALAGALVMQSRKQEAEDILQASIKEHPTDLGVKTLYLRMLVMNDDTDSARPLGTELLASAPQNWEVLYLNGELERRAGDYQQARDHLEHAVRLNPQNVECRQDLGAVLARLKNAPAAREQLEKAIALGSEDPEVRFELAAVLKAQGLNDEADKQLKLYQQEAQKKSDLTQAGAKTGFGDEKLAAGEPLQAAKLYREALTYDPKEPSLLYKLAMALDKAGDLTGEHVALEQAIAIDPGMPEALNQLGYLASRAGDTAAAENSFTQAVRASPGYTKAWINLAAMLMLESRFPEAKEAAGHALQLEPNNAQAQKLVNKLNELQAQQR
jgi:Flp pilus assembly protein TadD